MRKLTAFQLMNVYNADCFALPVEWLLSPPTLPRALQWSLHGA